MVTSKGSPTKLNKKGNIHLLVQCDYSDINPFKDRANECITALKMSSPVMSVCFLLKSSFSLIKLEKIKKLMIPSIGKNVGSMHSHTGLPGV